MVKHEFEVISNELKSYIQQAKADGNKFEKNIEDFPKYVQLVQDLEFLAETNLYEKATGLLQKLKK